MDIQFIELQHRENVLKLMELCNLEMNQAFQLYTNSHYNFEAAANQHFNPMPRVQQPFIPQEYPNQAPLVPGPQMGMLGENFVDEYEGEDQGDPKYLEYKFFRQSGTSFDQKYPVRKHQSFFQSIIPKFFKSEQQDKFVASLDKYVGKKTNIKNTPGNLSEALEWSWKQKYPVLLINMNFSPQVKTTSTTIFTDKNVVDRTFADQFKIYGFQFQEYIMQNELVPIFQPQNNINTITICRVNCVDRIQILGKIGLNQTLQDVKKKVKLYKSQCIQRQLEESHIVRQYQEERRGNYYQRPRTIKQSKKLKEDKKLRKQQEQQFFQACQVKKEEPEKANNNQIKRENYKPQIKKQEKHIKKQEIKYQAPKISEEQINKKREKQFSLLKKYSQGLTFKIRAPSGQNYILSVDSNQKVQYLFDYFNCHTDDLGFNNDIERKYDICMGFGGKQTLKGKENTQLKALFEDSQVLIIRETLD